LLDQLKTMTDSREGRNESERTASVDNALEALAPKNELLRQLPQVEQVLAARELAGTLANWRRDVLKATVQAEIARERREIVAGQINGSYEVPDAGSIARLVAILFDNYGAIGMRRVVNATGVVLHTNLGRAVLSPAAQARLAEVAAGYCDLEVDLSSGERSKRDAKAALLVELLLGVSATVINNCAGAVFLALHTLASGKQVITSRGELVEIGGAFRVPDIVRASGCQLVEVGTTNRTRLSDYEQALTENTGLILKTHRSNFTQSGFVEEASVSELAALGRKHNVPVVYDLGSGYLPVGTQLAASAVAKQEKAGAASCVPTVFSEPDIASALSDGASLVLFSGDKLFGGPQAGIIAGEKKYVQQLRQSPLWRALRCDKLALAALEASLLDHLSTTPGSPCHPANVLERSLQTSAYADSLRDAILAVQSEWKAEVIEAAGSWGGGSQPDEVVPSRAVVIEAPGLSADQLDKRLRTGTPAVMGYKLSGRYALNVLTLLDGDVERVAEAVRNLDATGSR
jgi:L-seryl-tRNA(Ser) seleniumtransferase